MSDDEPRTQASAFHTPPQRTGAVVVEIYPIGVAGKVAMVTRSIGPVMLTPIEQARTLRSALQTLDDENEPGMVIAGGGDIAAVSDATRAVLAGYRVRTTTSPTAGGGRMIALLAPGGGEALIRAYAVDGDVSALNQEPLNLADLVDQAMQHAAEDDDGDDRAEIVEALRCWRCGRIAGAGETRDTLDKITGDFCRQLISHTGEPCPGKLARVTLTVAPARTAAS